MRGLSVTALLAFGALVLCAQRVNAQITAVPLTIRTLDVSQSNLSFLVTNTGSATITAYAVEVQIPAIPGSPVTYRREVDGYPAAHERPLLQPGQSRQMSTPLPAGIEPSSVRIVPTAVVFDDLTSAGNTAAIERILTQRESERNDLFRLLNALKQLLIRYADNPLLNQYSSDAISQIAAANLASQISVTAKVKAMDEFSKELTKDTQSRVAGSLADSIQTLSKTDPDERDARIQAFIQTLERQYANAVRHTRKQ
jgi:hypothetical protein